MGGFDIENDVMIQPSTRTALHSRQQFHFSLQFWSVIWLISCFMKMMRWWRQLWRCFNFPLISCVAGRRKKTNITNDRPLEERRIHWLNYIIRVPWIFSTFRSTKRDIYASHVCAVPLQRRERWRLSEKWEKNENIWDSNETIEWDCDGEFEQLVVGYWTVKSYKRYVSEQRKKKKCSKPS